MTMTARKMLLGTAPDAFFAWEYEGIFQGFDLKKVLTFKVIAGSTEEGYPDTCAIAFDDAGGGTAKIQGKENIRAFFKHFFNVYGDGPNTIHEFFTQEK